MLNNHNIILLSSDFYLIWPGAGFRIQRPHRKNNVALCPGGKEKKKYSDFLQHSILQLTSFNEKIL